MFKPGKSGNPSGRPKSELGAYARKVTKDGKILVDRALEILKEDDSKAAIQAIEFLRDTGWGKPKQEVDITGGINLVFMPPVGFFQ